MKNVRFALILTVLALAASACSSGGGNPVTGPSIGFTVTRIVIGLANEGIEETGRPIPNGGMVAAGTTLKYNAYFRGPDGPVTIIYKTFRNEELVDTMSFTGQSFNLGVDIRAGKNYTPMVSGSYKVEVSIVSAPNTASATYEAR